MIRGVTPQKAWYDGLVYQHRQSFVDHSLGHEKPHFRHPDESRGPEIVSVKTGNQFFSWIPGQARNDEKGFYHNIRKQLLHMGSPLPGKIPDGA